MIVLSFLVFVDGLLCFAITASVDNMLNRLDREALDLQESKFRTYTLTLELTQTPQHTAILPENHKGSFCVCT